MNSRSRTTPVRALVPGTLRRAAALAVGAALVLAPATAQAAQPTVRDAAATTASGSGATTTAQAVGATATVTADGSEVADGGTVEQIAVTVPPADPADSSEPAASPSATPDATQDPEPSPSASIDARAGDAPEVVADTPVADAVETPVVETDDFAMIGITWPQTAEVGELAPQVRVRTDGVWSEWVDMEIESGGPDDGTADAASTVRGGTEPLWVDSADAVQARFAAQIEGGPDDLRLELVQPEEQAVVGAGIEGAVSTGGAVIANAAYTTAASSRAAAVLPTAAAPAIITRAQWGAPSPVCSADVASGLVGAVVHHTASSNGYTTVDQAAAQIRSFFTYHTQSRGWCDIGYNFLVDKWGNIYEGRAGSMTQPVIGVHDGGFNTGTVGVAMIGTYTAAPSAATQQAVGRVIGWRLGQYGVDPQGTMSYYTGNGENSKYKNTTVTLPRVFGHRDTAYTTCPGDGGYAALASIRATAKQYAYDHTPLIRALYQDLLGRGADASGLATWSGQLAAGVSQSQLVATLTNSDEYLDKRITQTYQNILGRKPDASGLAHWHRVVRAGVVSIDDLPLYFLASDELYARGGGTDQGFVNIMYQQVLGRSAWQSERVYWAAFIPSGGRAAALNGIWISRESSQRRAAVYYQTFLGRSPDAGGLAMWTDVLMSRGESAVRTGIAGSQEYYNRAVARF